MYRAYHTQGPPVICNGVNTVPIYRFLTMLKSTVSRFKPEEVVLTWDKRITSAKPETQPDPKSNFRRELVQYKEQRTNEEEHTIIHDYIAHIQKFTDALGIETIYPCVFEADDVIAFLTTIDEKKNIIISSDKDLLQLVSDKTHLYLPSKKTTVTPLNFEEVVGVKLECFLNYKAILGDISDNIPGIERYGPVKAKKLAEAMLNQTEYTLTDEQTDVLNRNLMLMNLHYMNDDLIAERVIYRDQFENNKISFNASNFRSACYAYGLHTFIREVGSWRTLFDHSDDYTEIDLLSMISM
jgi:5'-3' exonuclease